MSELIKEMQNLSLEELELISKSINVLLKKRRREKSINDIKSLIKENGYCFSPNMVNELNDFHYMYLPYYLKLCSYDKSDFSDAKVYDSWDTQEEWVEMLKFEYSNSYESWVLPDESEWEVNDWDDPAFAKVDNPILIYYKLPERPKSGIKYTIIDESLKYEILEARDDKVYIDDEFYCNIDDWEDNNCMILL